MTTIKTVVVILLVYKRRKLRKQNKGKGIIITRLTLLTTGKQVLEEMIGHISDV
jgi:hypothetical protein